MTAGPETLAGEAGAGPAGDQREVVLEAVAHERRDVLGVFRDGDGERSDLERAGVGRVQPARQGVEAQPPAEQAAKVVGELLGVEHKRSWSVISCWGNSRLADRVRNLQAVYRTEDRLLTTQE